MIEPYLADRDVTLYQGDALEVLRELEPSSVDCCVTSPPYWGLRDYGVDGQIGLERNPGDYVGRLIAIFAHVRRVLAPHGTLWLNLGDTYAAKSRGSDLGWDKSRLTNPGRVQKMQRASLREVIGERHRGKTAGLKEKDLAGVPWRVAFALQKYGWWLRSDVIEEVELYCPCGCGYQLEERVWRWAQDREVLWTKPNAMPESVTDRPTKAHEYVFLMTRSGDSLYWTNPLRGRASATKPPPDLWWFPPRGLQADPVEDALVLERERVDKERAEWQRRNAWEGHDYFFDQEAVREPAVTLDRDHPSWRPSVETIVAHGRVESNGKYADPAGGAQRGFRSFNPSGRNVRTVWEITTDATFDNHFAPMPRELARRCILAGCPEFVCRTCGIPRERIVQRVSLDRSDLPKEHPDYRPRRYDDGKAGDPQSPGAGQRFVATRELGWADCGHNDWRPGVVIDPFMGSGTTALAARHLGRHAIGIELNPEYLDLAAQKRLAQQSLLA
jgi:DNA modification methylase